ncbi:MAG: phenylacetate--CoA ligase family protein [Gemmatimonadetes bacterium]|nr:phenylacetate--CoA ligase family protein [Gemmatimonadota bacterium]
MTTTFVHADLLNSHYVEWGAFLRDADRWSSQQIADYQLTRLQHAVRVANETEGYRERFAAAGITPADLRSLDDLRRFPLIEKDTIRDRLRDFSREVPDREYVTTGGSTGVPFGFYRDKVAFARELASKAHQYHRIGWREGDPQLVFRGLPITSPDHVQMVPEFNELRCSSYHLVPEWMERFTARAFEYQPLWLRCYPSSGHIFARWLKDTGRRFPAIKGVLCASENLYDFQRDLMREVFNARVFSHYGHYELAVLAGFCEHEDTYHVLPQYGLAELLDPDGRPVTTPGAVGEIVGTSFLMAATPFIRYRTRDYARLKGVGCAACGRPYQVWDRIEGRLQEFIVTGTGRWISMTAINMHDDVFDHVAQFQFHQKERGKVTFRYIPRETCGPDQLMDIRRRLMIKLGDDTDLRLEAVSEIPPTARGKHRFLLQDLKLAFGDA